ncbi:MAG: ATP-dependent protease subunit HslV [Salinispira sp.]
MGKIMRSTTIIAVQKDGKTAMAGDGQVTMGNAIVKGNAKKVRKIYDEKVLTGFAGATADAFTLFDKFEETLREYNGDVTRAAVELAKLWRTDRTLRRLDALLLVASREKILLISGTGDVIEPETGTLAIGSGGSYAYAAARAYLDTSALTAREIARRSLKIAGEICIYTNHSIIVEELD